MKVSKYASRPVCVCLQISGWSSVSRRVPRRRVDLDLDLTYTHMHPLQRRVTVPGEMHPGKDDVARGASLYVPGNVAAHGIRRINRVHEQSGTISGVSVHDPVTIQRAADSDVVQYKQGGIIRTD